MIKLNYFLSLVAAALVSLGVSVYADEYKFAFTIGASWLDGEITFQEGNLPFGDDDPLSREPFFPMREMEIPVDAALVSFEAEITKGNWKARADTRISVTEDAGDTEYSDWGVPWQDPSTSEWQVRKDERGKYTVDVFAREDTDIDITILDFALLYKLPYTIDIRKGTFLSFLGFGYMNMDYNVEGSLVQQLDYRDDAGNLFSRLGTEEITSAYDITISIPYIAFIIEETLGKFQVEAGINFSPFADVEQTGGSLLGGETVSGDSDGNAYIATLNGKYLWTKHWFLGIDFYYLNIDTDGDQVVNYGGNATTIEQEVDSKQFCTGLTVNYSY